MTISVMSVWSPAPWRPPGTPGGRGPATGESCIARDVGSGEPGEVPMWGRKARTVPYLSGYQPGAADGRGSDSGV